jgi:CubicO group peptidase (beta-lactamase class C family)
VPSPAAALAEKYQARTAAFVKENRLPGAAVGVVHGGELAWAGGAGFADRASRRPSDPKTLYRIASITKTFTATAVMQLRDEGKLALTTPRPPISRAGGGPEPARPRRGPTIRRLLSTVRAQMSPGTDWSVVAYLDDPGLTLARAEEIATRVPVHTQWKHSNLAYQLLESLARVGHAVSKYIRSKLRGRSG